MQLRVVTDQPWDVKADVLAIPIVGEPAFDGPLGELNRRTGGELAALAAFGELRAKRFTSALAAPGENRGGASRDDQRRGRRRPRPRDRSSMSARPRSIGSAAVTPPRSRSG